MQWTQLYEKTSICSVKLPDTARKSLLSCMYPATCAWNIHDFSFREEGSLFYNYQYRHYCGDCVGVIWVTNMWKFMYLQGIHCIQGRIDQTSTLLMSFRFSFHRVSAHTAATAKIPPLLKKQKSLNLTYADFSVLTKHGNFSTLSWSTSFGWHVHEAEWHVRFKWECCWGFCPNSNFIFISKSL